MNYEIYRVPQKKEKKEKKKKRLRYINMTGGKLDPFHLQWTNFIVFFFFI